ncbi:DsbA family protein [Pseudaminobacter arsenicus]|uniref:DsbA family protein n=1 Tax=Borborobacter arsenicus TaxID=1851146 RepID=A0A432V3J0_9HYPH|nr:DsbA family protein [Pseudaminobacter arsenicus]RUM96769.1 DsbA family protein [Pseudaminobacter arsenicus]
MTRQVPHARTTAFLDRSASRRQLLIGLGAAGLLLGIGSFRDRAFAQGLDPEMVLNDPGSPVGGNAKGSLSIVTFFDYNCPFCRRASTPLSEVVAADGDIRLVYKEWPILTEASKDGAVLALAAQWQGKYETAHTALMAQEGRADAAAMRSVLEATDIDIARLDADLKMHRKEIEEQLTRNLAIAEALGLQGTPAYLIGPFLVASALDKAGFEQVIKDARARAEEG